MFTVAAGFVVEKIASHDGGVLDAFTSVFKKKPKNTVSTEAILPERFGPQPYAIYHERVVWGLTQDFDPQRIREVRNFLNRHDYFVEDNFHKKMPAEEVARMADAMIAGKMPLPERVDPKLAFMRRAERVLGKPSKEAASPPEDSKEGDSATGE
jgi:hypothetical protein